MDVMPKDKCMTFPLEINLPQRKISSSAHLLQSGQPTISFYNFLRGARDNFWKIIAEIDGDVRP